MMPDEVHPFLSGLAAEFDLVFYGQDSHSIGYRQVEPLDLDDRDKLLDYYTIFFGEKVPFKRRITEYITYAWRHGFIALETPTLIDGSLEPSCLSGEIGFARFSPRPDEDQRFEKLFRQVRYRLNKRLSGPNWIVREQDGLYGSIKDMKMTEGARVFQRAGGRLRANKGRGQLHVVCDEPTTGKRIR